MQSPIVGVTSRLHSLSRFLANRRRKLVLTPVIDSYSTVCPLLGRNQGSAPLDVSLKSQLSLLTVFNESSSTTIQPN
jgi:hypothetical protein